MWRPSQFVDFMLSSHFHFILTHVHQGLDMLFWDMNDLRHQLTRLSAHAGFPSGKSLTCPIFTQDKLGYLRAVPEMCNNTLSVSLLHLESVEEGYSDNVKDTIARYNYYYHHHKTIAHYCLLLTM